MKGLIHICKRNPVFFIGYSVFFLLMLLYCLLFSKPQGFLLINNFHNPFLDYFFLLFTNVGNGLFIVGLMIFLILKKRTGWSLQIGISFLISGIIVQLIKHFFPSPRPLVYFNYNTIHRFYNLTSTAMTSFPSGHTASVFALTTLLALYFPGRKSGLFFFFVAMLTGYSRIYLSQHFPLDVLAGSLIGCSISILIYQLLPLKIFEKKYRSNEMDPQSAKLR